VWFYFLDFPPVLSEVKNRELWSVGWGSWFGGAEAQARKQKPDAISQSAVMRARHVKKSPRCLQNATGQHRQLQRVTQSCHTKYVLAITNATQLHNRSQWNTRRSSNW
jgi:hypothetical protein